MLKFPVTLIVHNQMFTVLFIIIRKYISFQIAYDLNNNKTGLQPVSMTCGTGSLFWRMDGGTGPLFWRVGMGDRSIILEGG